ncbi:HpcH/HpaI aldolase/citrate lyase family protein [Fusobacterium mortiferum]|uniref:HpcH/HpaI aldolase/citrate lyase family protein n=1 Tax=Fusobacterium mortiferum TaxID=850 RepID=UPI00195A2E2E
MEKIAYEVGALMYSPALNDKVVEMIVNKKYNFKYSLALCLEDSICDDMVSIAQKQVIKTLGKIANLKKLKGISLPKIFIRVREAKQILEIFESLREGTESLTGFLIPKYSLENCDQYNEIISLINKKSNKKIYIMPILESSDIINLDTRIKYLKELKNKIDSIKEYILNIRVGGNDFCKEFRVRRNYKQTIYEITPVRNILSDILTVFSREYVVSGPVWEYFASENDEWKRGLEKEIELDKLNGFIGKTVIHPKQIEVVNEGLKVSKEDYEDAKEIIKWENPELAVGKSHNGQRMNEVKVHFKWAEKIVTLADIYGVKGE